MSENNILLTISLVPGDETTRVVVQHLQPVPKELKMALRTHDSQFFIGGSFVNWEVDTSNGGLTLSRDVPGPWGLDHAMSWCRMVEAHLARTLAIYQDLPDGDLPLYPMQFLLNGTGCPSWDVLDVEYQKLPLKTYGLGGFTLTQPTLRVTDPCYDVSTWCSGTLQAKPGRWTAQTLVGPSAAFGRNHLLQVHHESLGTLGIQDFSVLEKTGIHAGVDSGQCGFFDDALYPRDEAEFEWSGDTFYAKCCNSTTNRMLPGGAVIADCGAVSSSGYGDGSYNVYVRRNEQGEVVLALLKFIGRCDDDEDLEADDEHEPGLTKPVEALVEVGAI